MRIALGIEYHGGAYCGWQSQPSGCAIQDRLESAINAFLASPATPVGITCAGRTDAGVHALWQVAHFDTLIARDAVSWVRGVNAQLPRDIRILWARTVSDEFHSRFSATARTYRYLLLNDAVEPAVLRGMAGWFHTPLSLDAMRAAASLLVGEHDFSAFRAAECQARSPVKNLQAAQVAREGNLITFEFTANAFLHHMIRNIVGSLVYVGAGRHSVGEFAAIFAGRDRARAAPTFSPDGLYLADIRYDERFALPEPTRRTPF